MILKISTAIILLALLIVMASILITGCLQTDNFKQIATGTDDQNTLNKAINKITDNKTTIIIEPTVSPTTELTPSPTATPIANPIINSSIPNNETEKQNNQGIQDNITAKPGSVTSSSGSGGGRYSPSPLEPEFLGEYNTTIDPAPPFSKTQPYTYDELRGILTSMNATLKQEKVQAMANAIVSFDGRKFAKLEVFGNIAIRAYPENATQPYDHDDFNFNNDGTITEYIHESVSKQYVAIANQTARTANTDDFLNRTPFDCAYFFNLRWTEPGILPICYSSLPYYYDSTHAMTIVYVNVSNRTIVDKSEIGWNTTWDRTYLG